LFKKKEELGEREVAYRSTLHEEIVEPGSRKKTSREMSVNSWCMRGNTSHEHRNERAARSGGSPTGKRFEKKICVKKASLRRG